MAEQMHEMQGMAEADVYRHSCYSEQMSRRCPLGGARPALQGDNGKVKCCLAALAAALVLYT
jgi:hypothetical protein